MRYLHCKTLRFRGFYLCIFSGILKQAFFVLAVFVQILFAQTLFAQECPQELLPLTNAIVKVWCATGSGGTGTLVYADRNRNEGYVVTCKHVVEGAQRVKIVFRDGQQLIGTVVGTGQSYDTAIIKIAAPQNAVVIPVAEEYAPQNAIVHAFGYGGQYGININQVKLIHWSSKVHGYKRFGDGTELIRLDPRAQSGDSGGPIVYQNRLVGVVAGGELSPINMVPIDTHGPYCRPIRNLLRAIAPHALVRGIDAVRAENNGYG